ncbi:MAG: hypothetical protein ACRCVD_08190 [Halioglobus sp.]
MPLTNQPTHKESNMDNIDKLGLIKAQIAELQEQEKVLAAKVKGELFDAGEDALEGDLFRAAMVVQDRTTVDWKAVAAKLQPSRQLVKAHTKETRVISLRVSARSTSAARRAA